MRRESPPQSPESPACTKTGKSRAFSPGPSAPPAPGCRRADRRCTSGAPARCIPAGSNGIAAREAQSSCVHIFERFSSGTSFRGEIQTALRPCNSRDERPSLPRYHPVSRPFLGARPQFLSGITARPSAAAYCWFRAELPGQFKGNLPLPCTHRQLSADKFSSYFSCSSLLTG